MILDDNQPEPFHDSRYTYSASPKIQKQIQKLLEEEKAQQERTWSYYQSIRKEDPEKYAKLAVQMHADAIALGDKFADWED